MTRRQARELFQAKQVRVVAIVPNLKRRVFKDWAATCRAQGLPSSARAFRRLVVRKGQGKGR